jgi:hypothetical protein
MIDPNKLRALASWYREVAMRSGTAAIWVPRLQMAEDLDREADTRDALEQVRFSGRSPSGQFTR